MYYNGDGVEEDDDKAFFWINKAAQIGEHADAQMLLGDMYRSGHGAEEDITQAVHWYEQAGHQGNIEAQYNLGSMYYDGMGVPENKERAAFWWEKAADQGDAEAQFRMGYLYMAGEGVDKDPTKAVSLVKSAAAQGYEQAIELIEEMGLRQEEQNVADEDEDSDEGELSILGAANLYLKAAWKSDSELPYLEFCAPSWALSENNINGILNLFLDNLFEVMGKEPLMDIKEFKGKEAVLPYNITGDDSGKTIETWAEKISMIDRQFLAVSLILYFKAKDGGITLIRVKGDEHFGKYDEEEVNSFFMRGLQYHQGNGVEQDRAQAMYWMTKAAEGGHDDAQCYLADHYLDGKGVEQDFNKAFYWYTESAERGNSDAQLKLGIMYANGQGTSPNLKHAEFWLNAAAKQGDQQAQNILDQHFS